MFQIVCLELSGDGTIFTRRPMQPTYELLEDAMAIAEFDASRCGDDYGYDGENQCWWTRDGHGRHYRFVVEQTTENVESMVNASTVTSKRLLIPRLK
jgi:hypothetical protein